MTNVAVVVLDTLRKDAFDEYFQWLPGVRFEDAWSTSGWTAPVHASLFGGMYPSEMGVSPRHEALSRDEPVLAEHLSHAGFRTRGFSANAYISDAFAFTRGFDRFHHSWRGELGADGVVDWDQFVSDTLDRGWQRYVDAITQCLRADRTLKSLETGLKLKARDVGIEAIAGADDGAAEALERLRAMDFGDDEFLFLNLMEAHAPYDPPREYATVDIDTGPSIEHSLFGEPEMDPAKMRQAYDDCVRYLSDIYKDIFTELEDDFDYVVTLSDHGEIFGTDGLWGHNYGIHPELTHVPLSIYRGRDESTHRTKTVSLIDVHRTVLDLVDLEEVSSRGRNLFNGEASHAGYLVQRQGLGDSHVSCLESNGHSPAEIREYDRSLHGIVLPDTGFGRETPEGFVVHGHEEADYRERLDNLLATLEEETVRSEALDSVPADVRDRLSELGYV